MLKNFFLKKLAERHLKDAPLEMREKMMKLIEEKPELLAKIAAEAQAKMKEGKDQMAAMMEVLQAHKEEIRKVLE